MGRHKELMMVAEEEERNRVIDSCQICGGDVTTEQLNSMPFEAGEPVFVLCKNCVSGRIPNRAKKKLKWANVQVGDSYYQVAVDRTHLLLREMNLIIPDETGEHRYPSNKIRFSKSMLQWLGTVGKKMLDSK